VFSHGTVLDPATTREVAAGAFDPISGLQNTSANAVYLRDPFHNPAFALTGVTNFPGQTSQLNLIPASRLDPNAVKLLGQYPLPNRVGTSILNNNYIYNPTSTQTINQYDIRIDHTFGSRNNLFGVFDQSLWSEF